MRYLRWLLLAAILGIAILVGATYRKNKGRQTSEAPATPAPLESGIDSRSQFWTYRDGAGKYAVKARNMRQVKEPSVVELDDVELQLFHKDAAESDVVRSMRAQFDMSAKTLFSDGEVEITLGVPVDGPPHGRIVKIHSSGVTFQSETGKAATDRRAEFEFDQGSGSAVGADYDPQIRELHLRSQVSLDWRGKTAASLPMHIEAGEAFYKERDALVLLLPWSKLTRDTLHMEAGQAVVRLDQGEIRKVEAKDGRGARDDPGRKLEFGAGNLTLNFAGGMVVSNIVGEDQSRLVSTASATRTTVTGKRLEMDFETSSKESALASAVASGSSVAESSPIPAPGGEPGDTRILRSDVIHLKMREGGREIESVETAGAGTLDFLPNRTGQPKRFLKGSRIWISYAGDNRIQTFRSVDVSTRTDKPLQQGQPPPPPAITESKELLATFTPGTNDLARLEQKTNFQYQEGTRHAHSDRATLEQQQDLMTLEGAARVWDPTGSASADRIVMNQKSGDFTADGHVVSVRQPDQKGNSSAILSNEQVMQARAQRMTSTDNHLKIHYEGNAVAWQGANRVEADRLDIDRDRQVMEAHGKVVSQFVDKKKDDPSPSAKPAAAPVFTVVRAPDMVYTEEDRVVVYTGGAALKRPDLTVNGDRIRAFLKDADSDSSLDKSFADGAVKIVSTGKNRMRTGTSEHAEYYAGEQKVILQGGDPLLVDSMKGHTRGKQLTWYANDDRLLVNGEDKSKPAQSALRKK